MKNSIVILLLLCCHLFYGQRRTPDSLRTANFIRLQATAAGGFEQINSADTLIAGVMSASDKKKVDRIEVVSSVAELKNLSSRRTDVMYRLMNTRLKNVSDLYWDPNSTLTDDSVMVIQKPGIAKGRFLRYYEELYVEWFGAIPDDNVDDSYAFQKAINFAIRNAKSSKLKCGGGVFNVANLVVADYLNGNARPVAFTIQGVAPSYDAVSVPSRQTELRTDDKQAFTLAVQKGLNVLIQYITFKGASLSFPGSMEQLVKFTDADWNGKGTIRDNPYSPHAAIVIDPFSAEMTGPDRYPGAIPYYSNASHTGTSDLVIDGCSIFDYIVGVMVCPNPHSTNGDNIVFQNGSQGRNKVFWGGGQTQSRSNAINNLYSIGMTEFLVDTRSYGANTGTPPSVNNSSIAGGTKYLYNTRSNFSSMKFVNTYMESIWSLGRSPDEFPVTFTNCDINLETDGVFHSPLIAEGGAIHFTGGYISFFDNLHAKGLAFKNTSVTFTGTTIQTGVPLSFTTPHGYPTNVSFDNTLYATYGKSSILKKGISENQNYEYEHAFIIPDMLIKGQYGIQYKTTDNYFDETYMETVKITTDAATRTAYFISTTPKKYAVGDCLDTHENIDYANDIYSASATILGWVSAVNKDKITLSYVPCGINPNTAYTIVNARIQKFLPRVLGAVTKGSDIITNLVTSGGRLPLAGEFIKGTGIPPGTRVISAAPDKIVISQPATASANNVELYDAKIVATGTRGDELNFTQPFWYFGDRIFNSDPANPDIDYIRIKSAGVVGSAHPPTYSVIRN